MSNTTLSVAWNNAADIEKACHELAKERKNYRVMAAQCADAWLEVVRATDVEEIIGTAHAAAAAWKDVAEGKSLLSRPR